MGENQKVWRKKEKLVKPNLKMTEFNKHPVYSGKGAHIDGQPAGTVPQWQKAYVIPGADCETVADWIEELSGSFDVAAVGAGRVGTNAIRLTQTVAAGDRAVYLLLSQGIDLRWAKYIGFWYRGGAADVFTEGDIELYLFTSPTSYLRLSAYLSIDLFPGNFTEENPAVWHYAEFAISSFTVHAATRKAALKEVWGIGFYSDAGVNGNTLDIDHIEFYTHPTGYGPARGQIKSAPIADGVTLAIGYGLSWDIGSGRVSISGNNERNFAGIAVSAGVGIESGEVIVEFVCDGPVNMLCDDASIAAGEGVAASAVGSALTVDDGGPGSEDINLGRALETGATAAVITVLLDEEGTSA